MVPISIIMLVGGERHWYTDTDGQTQGQFSYLLFFFRFLFVERLVHEYCIGFSSGDFFILSTYFPPLSFEGESERREGNGQRGADDLWISRASVRARSCGLRRSSGGSKERWFPLSDPSTPICCENTRG